ncbi:MAG: zf-TFIIB domain-containing protein [Elusimicrobia bacterium]|nr:zf-TFIIB domain-containing protein [Elusimicrobiota bacterium]
MAESMQCPKCSAPLEAIEIATGVVVRSCAACAGVLYESADVAVPLALIGPRPARFDCPRCRRPMETATSYEGQIEVDRCGTCAALWFDAGEIKILRKLSGVENIAGGKSEPPPEPASPSEPPPAAGPRGSALPPLPPVKVKDGNAPMPPEMEGAQNRDAERSPTVLHEGRLYRHFQSSVPVTTSVLGEFPWVAKVGDAARARDFICPPYALSQEVTAAESVWSAGEYLEPEEVWAAFAMPGAPPAKVGVAPAQPNPWAGEMPAVWRMFGLGAAVCAGVFAFFAMTSSGTQVYDGSFSVPASDVERSRVGEVFEVKGRTSNLEITVDTNLEQQWAYVSMALIDADTDRALDFGRELSYYHGVDDGEAWSEGRRYGTLYVPSVPAGRYYLRVEPETDSPQLNFRVAVKRDVPLKRVPLIALGLLLLPALWAGMRHSAFENTRWMESDHPRTSSDDEEDE